MPKVIFLPHEDICPEGMEVEVPEGANLLESALEAGVDIDHACGGVGACTTCHVIVEEGFDSLNESSEQEDDMLDKAWGVTMNSRLSCQCRLGKENLTIEIPKYTLNHAKEEL